MTGRPASGYDAADEATFRSGYRRRSFLTAMGTGVALAAVGATTTATAAAASPGGRRLPAAEAASAPEDVPVVNGLHLQFGAEASAEVVVSWHALQPVRRPRVLLGRPDGSYDRTIAAIESSYTDAKSGQVVYAYHCRLTELLADHDYAYAALHDVATAEFGSFRTAPRGRARLTFTSFGDQGTPTIARRSTDSTGRTTYLNDNLGSPTASDTTAGVERVQPLFHLFNGDLCYANLADDRVRTWSDFWANNTRSARHRPWMPSAGNHENELGNGPIGYAAYQTYFSLPSAAGHTDRTAGLWYAFTAGSVRVISIANDDVCYQDGGNSYVRGYSHGRQKAWLRSELAASQRNRNIDWIVVCMHQVAVSTADKFNGADLGIREEWLPLFDRYGVDLVVCGHEHHYERSHPIRGQQPNITRTPIPVAKATDVIDTSAGTVHMVIGGGGTSVPSNQLFFDPPQCRVITAVGAPDPATGKRPPVYVREDAPWSAVRNAANSYGFAAFDVDPGDRRGGLTTMTVTYYDVVGTQGEIAPFETFTLQRPRRDGTASR